MTYKEFLLKKCIDNGMTLERAMSLLRLASRLERTATEEAVAKVLQQQAEDRLKALRMEQAMQLEMAGYNPYINPVVNAKGVARQELWSDEELVPGVHTLKGWIYKVKK
jgi:hypothetical protein